MEFSGVTKPIPPSSQSALQRTDAPMSAAAVRTQLPKDAAVQQVERSAAMQLEVRAGSQRQGALAGLLQRALTLAKARRSGAKAPATQDQQPKRVSAADALHLRAYGRGADQEQEDASDIAHEDRKV
jgi:hypothetical protein